MILSSFENFLPENSLENRVVLEVGWVLPWTNVYPTFDLWCTLLRLSILRKSVSRSACETNFGRGCQKDEVREGSVTESREET